MDGNLANVMAIYSQYNDCISSSIDEHGLSIFVSCKEEIFTFGIDYPSGKLEVAVSIEFAESWANEFTKGVSKDIYILQNSGIMTQCTLHGKTWRVVLTGRTMTVDEAETWKWVVLGKLVKADI